MAVKPGHQRILKCRGDHQRAQLMVNELHRVRLLRRRFHLQNGLRHLFHEEGHTVCLRDNRIEHTIRQSFTRLLEPFNHAHTRVPAEPVQDKAGDRLDDSTIRWVKEGRAVMSNHDPRLAQLLK